MLEAGLIAIVLLVLVLPVTVHAVERNIEIFLFAAGIAAVSLSHYFCGAPVWSWHLVREAFAEPLMISAAVLVVGLLVFAFRQPMTKAVVKFELRAGSRLFCFILVTALGLLSSVITAIMAALILVEVVSALRLDRTYETRLVILGCFSIGLGAALTPIGEPLSTIVIAKLRGQPYNADFFFLLRHLGAYIIPGVVGIGILGAFLEREAKPGDYPGGLTEREPLRMKDAFLSAGKVYLFVMALILLGAGFRPLIDRYIVKISGGALYWINIISAVLDNATLAAAEVGPGMAPDQLRMTLMGLLVAGGMLIPGNIPNIISAGRLGIRSKEWARFGVPFGLVLMTAYFIILELI